MGLPIEWYYEWIILAMIGYITYLVAYEKVGSLYCGGCYGSKIFIWFKEGKELVKVSVKVEDNVMR